MPREPVVIPLKHGKMQDLRFVSGGKRAGISVLATIHKTDCTELAIWEWPHNRRIGETWFKPDPVAAAVLEERERWEVAASAVLGSAAYTELLAALDAAVASAMTMIPFSSSRSTRWSPRMTDASKQAIPVGEHIDCTRAIDDLKQQLTACLAEVRTKINEYASLLGRCEFAEQQLAACREERDEALKTKVLGEEQRKLWRHTEKQLERVTNERDRLRKLCIFMQARFTTERPALTAKEAAEVDAALEPTK